MQLDLFTFAPAPQSAPIIAPPLAPCPDLPALLARLQDASERPRYAFMVLNLIARASGPSGRAGPYVREGETLVPVRDWLSDALAPMAGRAPSRVALTGVVRDALAKAGELPADAQEADRTVAAEVAERMRRTGRTNVSRAVSDLVRAGLLHRYYKGYRVDHDHRGAGRQAVYVVTADARAALAASALPPG